MLLIVYLVDDSVNGEGNHTECTRYARRECIGLKKVDSK